MTRTRTGIAVALILSLFSSIALADRTQWKRDDVNWRTGQGSRIKAVHHPEGQDVPQGRAKIRAPRRRKTSGKDARAAGRLSASTLGNAAASVSTVFGYDIEVNSPPVDGFVPWITVSVTNKSAGELNFEAVPRDSVVGQYPSGVDPDTDYLIGLYDTGASAHVMGYGAARQSGIYSGGLLTGNETIISGVTGSVFASITYPLGVFIDGLHVIDTATMRVDRSGMKGQSNVSIVAGQNPGNNPDLPTAIGSPMSVYYTAVFYNDRSLTVEREGESYTAPDIRIYEHGDARIPELPNRIPLELRPLGAVSVQYIPTLDLGLGGGLGDLDDLLGGIGGGGGSDFPPASPSVVIGNGSQSLFFVHSVDLYENDKSA
ncbi:MAG: hypothetical protein GY809_17860, partial [Planctomycetes bacterium]|nr:hypothetical protein [Planctomycetota bacterium]